MLCADKVIVALTTLWFKRKGDRQATWAALVPASAFSDRPHATQSGWMRAIAFPINRIEPKAAD